MYFDSQEKLLQFFKRVNIFLQKYCIGLSGISKIVMVLKLFDNYY